MKQEDIIKKYWFVNYSIECGNGWLNLLDDMCQEIQEVIQNKYPDFKTSKFPFEFLQIKEKYGILRAYPNFGNDEVFNIIDKYEGESYNVCEICGMKGKFRDLNGWYQILCDKHYDKRLKDIYIPLKELLLDDVNMRK